MKKLITYPKFLLYILLLGVVFSSCKKLYETDQELEPVESKLYGDLYEYRSALMGLYGLQQSLVEQLLVLGELRGDLLQITPNADADMIEVYNFNINPKTNKYASPINFFKLISACNRFISNLTQRHPEVLNKNVEIGNYDWFYGEALCMRAWAYFNAVRIYGKVPYIHETLSSPEEIMQFINTPYQYVDTAYIIFAKDGFNNDTIVKDTVLNKLYLDEPLVINTFTKQLESQVKFQEGIYAVGFNYARDNNDPTWEVTTWHPYSMFALLGHMYLTIGNNSKAVLNFEKITKYNSEETRYRIDNSFGGSNWTNIFYNIDNKEHIFTIAFSKRFFQQNEIQDFFINKFMLKPTYQAVSKWESCRIGQILEENSNNPGLSKMINLGFPTGDPYRGYLSSYIYVRGNDVIYPMEQQMMLEYKSKLDFRSANSIMDGADTLVYKYYNGKTQFDKDANYIVYRAAGIHLYLAEIYNYYFYYFEGTYRTTTDLSYGILNNGAYYGGSVGRTQLGIRGRVGLGNVGVISSNRYYIDGVVSKNLIFERDPYTNELLKPVKYKDYSADIPGKQKYLEDQVLNERALELAFEGERFYDLMRIAKRRNDNTYLAKIVSEKFPSAQRQAIYNHLLNERNWYINYFD